MFPLPQELSRQTVVHQQVLPRPDLVNPARENLEGRWKAPVQGHCLCLATSEPTETNLMISHNGLVNLIQ